MKTKFLLWGFAFTLLFTLNSCKSKESAYKQVYERAQQRPIEDPAPVTVYKPAPSPSPSPSKTQSNVNSRRESLTTIEGSGLKRFSIVVGSFIERSNASALKENMASQGYNAILVQNRQEMYRVIVASYDDRQSAVKARDQLKRDYYPDFQDAWLLEQEY